ncbi:MAG: J domain-containing protein [Merismopedia sp. SIO2A8]|nr:J domain-containing protein [Symploca sp. SIO2B6]NET50014.1 J domain-containing protein [Merismopedia sp. SIO2A8]
MDLVNCYCVLGVPPGAPFEVVKAAYRRLARRYHPDVNPEHSEWASQQFIEVTEAYQFILKVGKSPAAASAIRAAQQSQPSASSPGSSSGQPTNPPSVHFDRVPPKRPTVQPNPRLSEIDNRLKRHSYEQLQDFLRNQRFPRAIALVEGLAQRIKNDPEVQQWQAITYQQWARHLATQQEFRKAQIYLKKALKADPYNRRLWDEVKQEFRRIEQAIALAKS